MHLTPREIDKLILHQAGVLAQKRLARGLRLNYVESVALIATQLLEFIRDGRPVSELMDLGRRLLGVDNVLDGVAEMIDEVQVEGTFLREQLTPLGRVTLRLRGCIWARATISASLARASVRLASCVR